MLSIRDLPLLAAYAAVVRNGSFTGAARELKVSKSVVSEQVRRLEALVATRLLERNTRSVRVTEPGAPVLAYAQLVERELETLTARLEDEGKAPRGTLRVTTTYDLGHLLVAPAAAALTARHPALHFDIDTSDTARDLIEGRFDVAIRLGSVRASSLVARRLAEVTEPIVAAPTLAARYGQATRPRELRDAPWVRHSLVSGSAFRFTGPRGQHDEITVDVRAQANSGNTVRALIASGAGLGVLPRFMIEDDLAAGRLLQLCPGWSWKTVTLFALYAGGKHRRSSVDVFVREVQARVQSMELRVTSAARQA